MNKDKIIKYMIMFVLTSIFYYFLDKGLYFNDYNIYRSMVGAFVTTIIFFIGDTYGKK